MPAHAVVVRWERRPAFAASLTVAGGLLVAAGGWVLASSETVLNGVFPLGPLSPAGLYLGLLLVVVGSVELLLPSSRRPAGALVLALAALSVPLAFGGLIAGFILSVMGGTLAVLGPPPTVSSLAPPAVGGLRRR